MDRLVQFVLFTAFISSSYGFRIRRQTPQSSIAQDDEYYGYESHIYPDKLIKERLSQLSPDELKQLEPGKIIGDRVDDSSSQFCNWFPKELEPKILPEADNLREKYFIAPMKREPYQIQVCNTKVSKGFCYENATNIERGNRGCCFPEVEKEEMVVVSMPVHNFNAEEFSKLKVPFVKKIMHLRSKCYCQSVKTKPKGDDGTCDKPADAYTKQFEK